MDRNFKLNIISLILGLIILTSILVYFIFPNFQFRTFEMNRMYSVFFSILSIIFSLLLYFLIRGINNQKIHGLFFILNTFGLIISISTLFIFYNNIDPNVQFRDSEVLYVNNDNPNEKIIRQYDINWKTNKKEFFNNHVLDIGFFRIYKSYGIDIHKLNSNWK